MLGGDPHAPVSDNNQQHTTHNRLRSRNSQRSQLCFHLLGSSQVGRDRPPNRIEQQTEGDGPDFSSVFPLLVGPQRRRDKQFPG
jgi:hypothetical protein